MSNDLLNNMDKIHSTELGIIRIRKNLSLDTEDPISFCKQKIQKASEVIRKGKNWYVYADNIVITINAHSFTIITAHKEKINKFK